MPGQNISAVHIEVNTNPCFVMIHAIPILSMGPLKYPYSTFTPHCPKQPIQTLNFLLNSLPTSCSFNLWTNSSVSYLNKTIRLIGFYTVSPQLYTWTNIHSLPFHLSFIPGSGMLFPPCTVDPCTPALISSLPKLPLIHPVSSFFSSWSAFVFLLDFYPRHM